MKRRFVKMTPEERERIATAIRRAGEARNFPENTCPASRHLHIMADCLLQGGYPMLTEEPVHCAESLLAVIASLWEARSGLSGFTDAEVNAEFKRRNQPPPNPQAPTMKEKDRG